MEEPAELMEGSVSGLLHAGYPKWLDCVDPREEGDREIDRLSDRAREIER